MGKIIKDNLGNFSVICLVFLIVAVWIFSGWPEIWQKPPIPPKVEEAQAAAPTIESVTNSNQDGNSETFTVNMPATRPDGDLYIAIIAKDDDVTMTAPTGWNEIFNINDGTTYGCRHGVWWKIGSSEPSTYTWTGDSEEWSGAVLRITGFDTNNPINAIGTATGNSANPTSPSITPTVDETLILYTAGIDTDFWNTDYEPSGTSKVFSQNSGSRESGSANAAAASKAGDLNPTGEGAFSANGSDQWVASTIAIASPLVAVPNLEQIHYHWRNDDGTESAASSATGGSQDTALTGLQKNTTKRIRIEISNEGAANSGSITYRLEYGLKETTCAGITTWTDVGAAGGDWDMSDSTYLTDGENTTNIAISTGGVTDENTNFVAGQVKTTSSQTSGITLTTTQFTEIEYSIKALDAATDGGNYCFRLTNNGITTNFTYTRYPEVTLYAPLAVDQAHYRWRNDDGGEGPVINITPIDDAYTGAKSGEVDQTYNGTELACQNAGVLLGENRANRAFLKFDLSEIKGDITSAILYLYPIALTDTSSDIYATEISDDSWSESTLTWNNQPESGAIIDTTSDRAEGVWETWDVTSFVSSEYQGDKIASICIRGDEPDGSLNDWNRYCSKEYDGYDPYLQVYQKPATWMADEDTATTTDKNVNVRVRFSMKNTGATASDYNYRLQVAAKTETTCEAQTTGWSDVPVAGSCGTAVACMSDSAWFIGCPETSQESTTHQLSDIAGCSFISGKMVDNGCNQTVAITLNTNYFTELEYNFQFTNNATSGATYCLRVTDAGTALDSYTKVAEITIVVPPGATWKADENATTTVAIGENVRLRIAVANATGSTAIDYDYRLEYASKAGATCGDDESWITMPITATTEHFEMTTSTYFENGDPTTARLSNPEGYTFIAGKMVEDPSNSSGNITLPVENYTEIEFVFQANSNATSSYCFQLTKAGIVLDEYPVYPELEIE